MSNQEKLNKMCPVFSEQGIAFGDRLDAIITLLNDIKANFDKAKKMLTNICLSSGGLTLSGTTKDQLKTVATVNYTINGKIYSKTAADPLGAWTAGHTGLGNSQEAYYLVCLDSSGALTTVEGEIVAAGSGCVLPKVPADKCAIGAVKVVTNASGVFVPDTTELDNANITVTYENLAVVHSGEDFIDLAADVIQSLD